jgi:hypothetical protein
VASRVAAKALASKVADRGPARAQQRQLPTTTFPSRQI